MYRLTESDNDEAFVNELRNVNEKLLVTGSSTSIQILSVNLSEAFSLSSISPDTTSPATENTMDFLEVEILTLSDSYDSSRTIRKNSELGIEIREA